MKDEEGASHTERCKSTLSRGNSTSQGPEAGKEVGYFRNRRKFSTDQHHEQGREQGGFGVVEVGGSTWAFKYFCH